MKSFTALQELIKENEKRIKLAKQQLSAHESGEAKMSVLTKTSTENTLAKATEDLARHQKMMNELSQKDIAALEEQERMVEAVRRKNYFHYQKVRLKRDTVRSNDQKLEAMLIVDELPEGIEFDDEGLFDIAEKSLELQLSLHEGISDRLKEIKESFNNYLNSKDMPEESIKDLEMLNYRIPIIVLYFSILRDNIQENMEENGEGEFSGFPKYEDWWIKELWSSHQAYFALFKWKSIIAGQCKTSDQKRTWDMIFSNWVFVKKLLNGKKRLGYEYNFAFDTILANFAGLEEEIETPNLKSMEKIILSITSKENFNTVSKDHNVITSYLKFKREKVGFVEDEEEAEEN
jgi:hypothetical protein